jgi:hypothetical protein
MGGVGSVPSVSLSALPLPSFVGGTLDVGSEERLVGGGDGTCGGEVGSERESSGAQGVDASSVSVDGALGQSLDKSYGRETATC